MTLLWAKIVLKVTKMPLTTSLGKWEELEVTGMFRLGKKINTNDDNGGRYRCRPIKIIFHSATMAKKVLLKSRVLKDLYGETVKMYFKPDKTKYEREEYTRLGKQKTVLMERHPTPDGGDPRVVVKYGRLYVDNAEVDSYRSPQTLF